MRVLIRGAGDLASGIALRLHRAGLDVVMTDLEKPTAIRRTVCFSQALVLGAATVEDVRRCGPMRSSTRFSPSATSARGSATRPS